MRARFPKLLVSIALPLCLSLASCSADDPGGASSGEPAGDLRSKWPTVQWGRGRPEDRSQGGQGGGDAEGGAGPKVESLLPPRGASAGGTLVVLRGSGFTQGVSGGGERAASEQTQVVFGDNPALTVRVIDDDTVEVVTPAGVSGVADVTLTNPKGVFVCAQCFTFFSDVKVTRVSPTVGTTGGGEAVTVTGTGFVPGVTLLVDGQAATEVAVSPDGTQLTARTPPGAPGSADVAVIGLSSVSTLKRGYQYVVPLRLEGVRPAWDAVAGGAVVEVSGTGFTAGTVVRFGDVVAGDVKVDASGLVLKVRVPPAAGAGRVDVTLGTRYATAVFPGAFAYVGEGRDVRLHAAAPALLSTDGGTCAVGSGCLTLVGEGLEEPGLQVMVGSRAAVVVSAAAHEVRADVPASDEGPASVQVRTARGGALLANAVTYVRPLVVSDVSPAAAPASGTPTVEVTVTGRGFSRDCRVFFGSVEGEVRSVQGETGLVVVVPPGSPGVRDVRVACGGSAGGRASVLEDAFEFQSPLRVLQVDPPVASRAGGLFATLYGSGFGPDLEVFFGTTKAVVQRLVSPQQVVVKVPRGETGPVDLAVTTRGETDVLAAAFTYIDPTNRYGGASGGPMRGVLNVTVWNTASNPPGPFEGATVTINDGALLGLTDDRGQITFADPLLLKPVDVTASAPGSSSATVARIDARNLTLLVRAVSGEPMPSEMPVAPPGLIRGRVCGFKTAPGFAVGAGQRLVARVGASAPNVYDAPPFADPPAFVEVNDDCGEFELLPLDGNGLPRFGPLAVWATFGLLDETFRPARFAPLLMGIRRGLSVDSGQVTEGDVTLDMHLDQTIPVTVDSELTSPAGDVGNTLFSYLDLGGEGVVPLAATSEFRNDFTLDQHPRVAGDGLLFLNVAAPFDEDALDFVPPFSYFFRRQYGRPEDGVTLGPMLAFPVVDAPQDGGTFEGTLSWHYGAGALPDLGKLSMRQPQGMFSIPVWDVVLPGGVVRASMPSAALQTLPAGAKLRWSLLLARSPRLDYDQFSNNALYINEWTAFVYQVGACVVP
ncbi:MAG: hypothetical protein RL199_1012 [Pseudomonadota bacterium]|jgi:hypothetical protein